jgi:hypothetical protein
MTVFFTKTCARDWERCGYQAIALNRLFPLATHVILSESKEFGKAHDLQSRAADPLRGAFLPPVNFDRDVATYFNETTLKNVRFMSVETLMPEAMRIENPDLRQMYCKLRAPVVLGEDTIQLDSDMCPKPVQTRWMDHLYYAADTAEGRPRWHAPDASKAMKPGVELAKTYRRLPTEPATSAGRDQRAQFGWYIPRNVARTS